MIEEESSGMVVLTEGPLIRDWRETDPVVTVELRDGELQPKLIWST